MRFLVLLIFVPLLLACQAREAEPVADASAPATDVVLSASSSKIETVLRNFDESVRSKQIEQKARTAQSDADVTPEHMFYSSEITRLNNVVLDLQSANDVMQAELTFCRGKLSIHEKQVTKLVDKKKGLGPSADEQQDLFLEKTKVRIYDLIVLYNTLLQYEKFITDVEMRAQISNEMVRVKAELTNYGVDENSIIITNFNLIELIKGSTRSNSDAG
jgi:hypothetical protein